MITYRERMLATLRGQPTDFIPFVPRLDLWYKANKYKGTLPDKYRNATLMDIVDDMDIGYHAVITDKEAFDDYLDIIDRPLGIWRVHQCPWAAKMKKVKRNISYQGDTTVMEYLTPAGNLMTRVVYNESMKAAGVTLTHVEEFAIKNVTDYDAMGYIFENMEVVPAYDGIQRIKEEVGERGLITGVGTLGGSAMHHIIHELMPYDLFFFEYYDHYDELLRLAERMQPFIDKVLDIAIKSPADIVFIGSNFDSQVTWPPFVGEHVVPNLAAAAGKVHAAGKFLLCHTDGENKGLLPHFIASKFDIADSICPAPMTSCALKEIRDAFNGHNITIWGGVPSVSVLESSMSDYEFDSFIDDLFGAQIGQGDHLILSIADTAPPAMKWSRLERIAKMAKEFGPVKP
ncbi:MAG: hypothetical protein AB9917_01850 [Negativicutes bacterium]